jgi:hypothetical protein
MLPPVEIPLIDLGDEGPLALLRREPERAVRLIEAGRQQFGAPVMDVMDRLSRRWARRARPPYLSDLETAAGLGLPTGIWFMNLSYEWGCTTSATEDLGGGIRMRRTLDWPFHGLGRELVVTAHSAAAGIYYNVTWSGYLGVVTALCPNRFAVAINQAPILRRGPGGFTYPWVFDWLANRVRTYRGDRMPPTFLLRQVCEKARDFEEAVVELRDTPLALPVFFTLAGTERGQAVVIERCETEAYIEESPAVVANHWLNSGLRGRARGVDSVARHQRMIELLNEDLEAFAWLEYPILNSDTRLALEANAANDTLKVMGYERDGAATSLFDLSATKRPLQGSGGHDRFGP